MDIRLVWVGFFLCSLNWKRKAFAGGGTEITAGAYPASVTTDVVQFSITARKLP